MSEDLNATGDNRNRDYASIARSSASLHGSLDYRYAQRLRNEALFAWRGYGAWCTAGYFYVGCSANGSAAPLWRQRTRFLRRTVWILQTNGWTLAYVIGKNVIDIDRFEVWYRWMVLFSIENVDMWFKTVIVLSSISNLLFFMIFCFYYILPFYFGLVIYSIKCIKCTFLMCIINASVCKLVSTWPEWKVRRKRHGTC